MSELASLKGLDTVEDRCPDRKDSNRIPGMLFGPAGAGKTTLLHRFCKKTGEIYTTWGGKRSDNVTFRDYIFDIFDFGGQERFRHMYIQYSKAHAARFVIFMVDGADKASLPDGKAVLERLITQLPFCYFLILINKMDEKGCLSTKKVRDELDMDSIDPAVFFEVKRCSAESGKGVEEAFGWLAEQFAREEEEEADEAGKPKRSPYH